MFTSANKLKKETRVTRQPRTSLFKKRTNSQIEEISDFEILAPESRTKDIEGVTIWRKARF